MSTDTRVNPAGLVRVALNGPTMGSRWSAAFFAPESLDPEPVRYALQDTVDRVDRQMSTWKPESDLNRLNGASVGTWLEIPRELATVLGAALAIGRASAGLFDIGVGDLVTSWGFGPGAREPDLTRIAAARQMPIDAPKNLQLDVAGCRARRLAPIRVDLSGIAKGFGVDELARVLRCFGIESFLVGIDGEMRAGGPKPEGQPWIVGHEQPTKNRRDLAGILELRDIAVATSGNYRHLTNTGGREVSHTMDPRTGEPLVNDLAAVTVLAPTCMVADAWATALIVAGSNKALSLARTAGVQALLVRTDGTIISSFDALGKSEATGGFRRDVESGKPVR